MSKVIRILSLAVLLAAIMGCRKTPVDNGEEPGQEPQEYERYVKGNRFRSQILGEHITYSLFMPADYESNTEASYPVIYFLHGFGESSTKDWTKYMNVIASLEESQGVQPMIYVFPNGYNSYYSNTYDGKFPYMDMFINELVPYIDANYRTVADREHRGIMGYSMGGFGAMVLAMKHPETFGMSAPMSMSFRTDALDLCHGFFGGFGAQSNQIIQCVITENDVKRNVSFFGDASSEFVNQPLQICRSSRTGRCLGRSLFPCGCC